MIRNAFKGLRVIHRQGEFDSKGLVEKVKSWARKNEGFSESVNSFDFRRNFPISFGQDISRNASVVFVYAF